MKCVVQLLAFAATGLAMVMPSPLAAKAEQTETSATETVGMPKALRAQVLDQAWAAVNAKYYDPAFNGADWPKVRTTFLDGLPEAQDSRTFYRYLNRMLATLKDAHTTAISPTEVALRKNRQKTSVGVSLALDGTVMSVELGSLAQQSGLRPGMTILSIDGKPLADRARELRSELIPEGTQFTTRAQQRLADRLVAARLLSGEAGSSVQLGLAADASLMSPLSLTRQLVTREIVVESKLLPSGFGYVAFDGFKSKPLKQVREALVRFESTPGLVIDLRENGGGDFKAMVELANWFFDKQVPFGTLVTRDGKPLSFLGGLYKIPLRFDAGGPGLRVFSKPVVILVSEKSASASEYFSAGMRENGRAKLVGTLSCGCTNGAAGSVKLADGGQLRIGNFGSRTPLGSVTEGNGLQPDRVVEPTIADLRNGEDPALRAAEALLLGLQ
jgi:carboxyl-terminal processing protease